MDKTAKEKRKPVTLRMDTEVIEYFKQLSEKTGIPYQNLINLYLLDCVKNKREVSISLGQFSSSKDVISSLPLLDV